MDKYAVVSYVPALHRGYVDFFKKYPGTLYLLSPDFVQEEPHMDRDIRAFAAEEAQTLIQSLKLFSKVVVLKKDNLDVLKNDPNPIILPDEELNHRFVDTYLKDKEVSFVSVFLRWDKKISTTEFEVPPDRTISEDVFHKEVLSRAATEAQKSPDWWRQIGVVLIRDKKSLFTAYNKVLPSEYSLNTFGDPRSNFDAGDKQIEYMYKTIHAEAAVIAEAAKQGVSTDGAALYITTFPCPVCARSIVTAGIKEIYYAKGYSALDAEDILRAFSVKITMVK